MTTSEPQLPPRTVADRRDSFSCTGPGQTSGSHVLNTSSNGEGATLRAASIATVATVRDGNCVQEGPGVPNSTDDFPAFARNLLNTAANVEAAEQSIKEAILTAARAGDTARVEHIVSRWLSKPSMEVLAESP